MREALAFVISRPSKVLALPMIFRIGGYLIYSHRLLKKDFPENLTELQLGEDRQLRLYVAGRKDLRAIETKNKDKAEWLFENRQCPSCTKTLYLSIEDESESTITYLMQSEDDNSPFAYRFIFRRIKK